MLKLRLFPKMLVSILIPVLLGLCAVVLFNFFSAKKTINGLLQEELALVADRQQSEMLNLSLIIQDILTNNASLTQVLDYLEEKGKIPQEEEEELRLIAQKGAEAIIKDYTFFTSATLMDTKGIIVAFSDPKRVGQSRADRVYFKDALQGKVGKANIIATSTKKLTTMIAMPVKNSNGQIIGVISIGVDLTRISNATVGATNIGKTGKCYLFDSSGMVLAHPDETVVGKDYSETDWLKTIVNQKNGYIEFTEDGVARVGYFRDIPNVGWHILVSEAKDEILEYTNTMLKIDLFIGILAAIVVCFVVFLIAKNTVVPLQHSAHFLEKVASGQLEFSDQEQTVMLFTAKRSDEIGWLAKDIMTMVNNLRKLFIESEEKTKIANNAAIEAEKAAEALTAQKILENAKQENIYSVARQIEKVSIAICRVSTELSQRIECSESGANRQAAIALETATAMSQMSSTVLEVAKNAGTASDVSFQTKEKAEEGVKVVNEAISSINLVQSQSLLLKEKMSELDFHAQEVSQVMGVISDIADQTNLLALNAAIEAARAGDAGRGFAVVADEVRKLAEKTMTSTVEVGKTVSSIQKSATESTQQVEKSVEYVAATSDLATRSGNSLTEILSLADRSSAQVQGIASAAEEQSATAEQINESVREVSSIAKETTEAMGEAITAVLSLNDQVRELGELIEKMKSE